MLAGTLEEHVSDPEEQGRLRQQLEQLRAALPELLSHYLSRWEGVEREAVRFSIALHEIIAAPAPETALQAISEGLRQGHLLVQIVAARYLERLLPVRTEAVLQIYHHLLRNSSSRHRNVRRAVAKALPAILPYLRAESSVRHLAQHVISCLAGETDLYIRRAVADRAMHILSLDREFLLTLLQQMHRDADPAIRYRLRPVALRLAEIWLVWYAHTVRLLGAFPASRRTTRPFGEQP
ncbi:hypothetical protein [Thermogemmatispora sp.]|uniref:hypothetical protein n=1 Tax=Thermogemmatispora sp. TaxID=1968838 RepID=UPI002623769A|nr:hypothetical protein [Thermogemmatispora sp.]